MKKSGGDGHELKRYSDYLEEIVKSARKKRGENVNLMIDNEDLFTKMKEEEKEQLQPNRIWNTKYFSKQSGITINMKEQVT